MSYTHHICGQNISKIVRKQEMAIMWRAYTVRTHGHWIIYIPTYIVFFSTLTHNAEWIINSCKTFIQYSILIFYLSIIILQSWSKSTANKFKFNASSWHFCFSNIHLSTKRKEELHRAYICTKANPFEWSPSLMINLNLYTVMGIQNY